MPSIVLFQLRWNQVPYAQRSARAERADKNSSSEERNAPVRAIDFHVHDWDACEAELVKRSLVTCSGTEDIALKT